MNSNSTPRYRVSPESSSSGDHKHSSSDSSLVTSTKSCSNISDANHCAAVPSSSQHNTSVKDKWQNINNMAIEVPDIQPNNNQKLSTSSTQANPHVTDIFPKPSKTSPFCWMDFISRSSKPLPNQDIICVGSTFENINKIDFNRPPSDTSDFFSHHQAPTTSSTKHNNIVNNPLQNANTFESKDFMFAAPIMYKPASKQEPATSTIEIKPNTAVMQIYVPPYVRAPSTGTLYHGLNMPTSQHIVLANYHAPVVSFTHRKADVSANISANFAQKSGVPSVQPSLTNRKHICTYNRPAPYRSILKNTAIALPQLLSITYKIDPSTPTPPNWDTHSEDTIRSLAPYKVYPVHQSTKEYQTLSELLSQIQINSINQIVNPNLWSRFVNTRREMLKLKSDDLQLLSKLGLDDKDLMRKTHNSINFNKDPAVAATPYNDNFSLLFHCTRDCKNINNILLQGLDERLGNVQGGLLGRGIYFSDNPLKSIQYDGCNGTLFIFGVLLGDCLAVNHKNFKTIVREPEKFTSQKRNVNDLTFDSIVAQIGQYNEYVVYNRFQCCPLYKIEYCSLLNRSDKGNCSIAPISLPPFSWVTLQCYAAFSQWTPETHWPYNASILFLKMEEKGNILNEPNTLTKQSEIKNSINEKLSVLASFGFDDVACNLETLSKCNYDLEKSANYLLDAKAKNETTGNSSNFLVKHSNTLIEDCNEDKSDIPHDVLNWVLDLGSPNAIESSSPTLEACLICSNEYELKPAHWHVLKCSHKLCFFCYQKIETTGTTMGGISHTFIKCPFCALTTGTEIGTCPDGTMMVTVVQGYCEGYNTDNSLKILYCVKHKNCLHHRAAYLPNNAKGNDILKLLKIAWDRRICFSIGTNNITGEEDTLIWNIHHKTAPTGGINLHGFPDPGYFDRVIFELKCYGIK